MQLKRNRRAEKPIPVSLIMIVFGLCMFCFQVCAQYQEVGFARGISHICKDREEMAGGVAFLDYNNDGFDDIYLTGGELPDKLFDNQGDGTFLDVSTSTGINQLDHAHTMGIACGDLDNDGYVDIILSTKGQDRCYVLWNRQGESFQLAGIHAGFVEKFYGSSIALGDYNLDGKLDILVGKYDLGAPGDLLYLNNGDRSFTNTGSLLGSHGEGTALAMAFSDIDLDNDPDVLIANDFGYDFLPNQLLINNYPETGFTDISTSASWDLKINSMGIAIGDYDSDGDLDYYISDFNDNYLLSNIGEGNFKENARERNVANDESTSWGVAFLDYNNDMEPDLFVANGDFSPDPFDPTNKLYHGKNGFFENLSDLHHVDSDFTSRGVAIGDFNNDGKQDLLVGVVAVDDNTKMHTLLYENQMVGQNWIQFDLTGTDSNRDGYGALISVFTNGKKQIREKSGGGSYLSNHSPIVHFGLGAHSSVDSLTVQWPGRKKEVHKNLEANYCYSVNESVSLFQKTSVQKTIKEGEKLYLQGAYRKTPGIYHDTIPNTDGYDKIVITRLLAEPHRVTALDETSPESFQVWPNPFTDHFYIKFNEKTNHSKTSLQWSIRNALGMEISKGENTNLHNPQYIKASRQLPSGVYFFTFNVGTKSGVIRLLKD